MKLKNRPKLDIPVTPLEKFVTATSFLLIVWNVAYLLMEWSSIPQLIPGHYNASGEVDRWGGKWELSLPILISSFVWVAFTILEKYPHIYNYINLTEQNVELQYILARKLMNTIKFEVVALFVLLNLRSIKISLGEMESLGEWYLPLFLGVLFGTLAFYFYRMLRSK